MPAHRGADTIRPVEGADAQTARHGVFQPPKGDTAEGLNAEQRRAVETDTGGAVLVVAGPGTGKTRTLTRRIVHLVDRQGVSPRHILAVTFTRKAADEMRQRLGALLDSTASLPHIATFHALCWSILKTEKNGKGMIVIDRFDQKRLLTQAVKWVQRRIGPLDRSTLRQIQQTIRAKLTGRRTNVLAVSPAEDGRDRVTAQIDDAYRKILAIQNLCDYDDLIERVIRRLETDPARRLHYQQQFRQILVDEYQDIDAAQFRLLTLLSPQGKTLFAIGDPDQSIYFNNKKHAERRGGRALILAVLRLIEARASYLDFKRYSTYSGLALHAAPLETFTQWGLEHGLGLNEALSRVRRFALRPLKKNHQRMLIRLSDHIRALQDQSRDMTLIQRLENVSRWLHPAAGDDFPDFSRQLAEMKTLAAEYGPESDAFFSAAALTSDTDLHDPQAEAVSLMTLHAAKGLEFSIVFLSGCEDGYLPLEARQGEQRDLEEERRLFYVGMTRARDALVLSYADWRRIYGKRLQRRPSPFLQDIETRLTALERPSPKAPRSTALRPRQMRLF
jgi:DNA helicase-2/ATP-dependent DNA helicase PcrA